MIVDYNAELKRVLANALRTYGRATRSSTRKWEKDDRLLDKQLKENVHRIIGEKNPNTKEPILPDPFLQKVKEETSGRK